MKKQKIKTEILNTLKWLLTPDEKIQNHRTIPSISLKGLYLYATVVENYKVVEFIRYDLKSGELEIAYNDYREPKVLQIDTNMKVVDLMNMLTDINY